MVEEIIQRILVIFGVIVFLAFPIWLVGPIYDRGWHNTIITPIILSAASILYIVAGFRILSEIIG